MEMHARWEVVAIAVVGRHLGCSTHSFGQKAQMAVGVISWSRYGSGAELDTVTFPRLHRCGNMPYCAAKVWRSALLYAAITDSPS